MKKSFLIITLTLCSTFFVSAQTGLSDLFKAIGSKTSGDSTSTTSTISDAIDAISSIVGTGDIKAETLVGKWTYSKPAVAFENDDFIQKAGGAVASQMIVNKITPYYNKLGAQGLTMEFTQDGNFTINRGALKISGTYEAGENGKYILNIKALGKIPAGKLNVYISGNSRNIQVTCSADKLISIASTIADKTSNASIKKISSILGSQKGLYIGMELKK